MTSPSRAQVVDLGTRVGCLALVCSACTEDSLRVVPNDATLPDAAPAAACPIKTGYPGDELCIEPPDPSKGIQLHYGPPSYDDPDVVAPFLVQPNEEISDCFFIKTPNDTDMPVGEFHARMRPSPGSTLIIYTGTADHADGLSPCPTEIGTFWGGSRSEKFDSPPPGPPVPENDGFAVPLPARTQAMMSVHFENESNGPILREVWANLVWRDPETVTSGMASVFFLGGLTMNVMPGASQPIRGTSIALEDLRIVAMVGHFHTHTRRFTAWKAVGNAPNDAGLAPSDGGAPAPAVWGTGLRTQLIEAYDWSDPGTRWFDSVSKNPVPNAGTRQGGGVSGLVELKMGDRIDWECDVMNDLTTPLQFSNSLRTGEMCNIFGLYVLADHSLNPPVWRAAQ